MEKIIIYGVGSFGKMLTQKCKNNTEIVAYLSDYEEGYIDGIPVISFDKLCSVSYDYIVVAFGDSIKGIESLIERGIPEEKIVGYAYSGMNYSDNVFQKMFNEQKRKQVRDELIPVLFDLPTKNYYLCDTNIVLSEEKPIKDFVREQMLVFLSREIYRRNIEGCILEIGVSEGTFARSLNLVFPDRMLFLFDTYGGLTQEDRRHAISLGWGEKAYANNMHIYTPDDVLRKMPYPDNCQIREGIFPDSFEIDEQIAFASVDLDFYSSTKRGLEMIYSKLAVGGYIMVHDFNNIVFQECQNAVLEFCYKNNVSYVPIPDISGSVILTK